jgi:hypothetical protein
MGRSANLCPSRLVCPFRSAIHWSPPSPLVRGARPHWHALGGGGVAGLERQAAMGGVPHPCTCSQKHLDSASRRRRRGVGLHTRGVRHRSGVRVQARGVHHGAGVHLARPPRHAQPLPCTKNIGSARRPAPRNVGHSARHDTE